MTTEEIKKKLSIFNEALVQDLLEASQVAEVPAHTELLREGQYIKVIPIVLEGLVKVFTRHEDRELLLYYIQPTESCIMSYSASLKNTPSHIYAETEEESTIILVPVDRLPHLRQSYPDFSTLFIDLYNSRYRDLLDTIHHVLFDRMDKRLLDYLKEKVKVRNQNPVKLSHQQIADELGTVREVISRVIKKLEIEGVVIQDPEGIKIVEV
ncbi:MAG: Crp/Fnr family transcriptional regulator [Flavobacteriaceae bacterium]|nr:Crp/Fnr family transcriptional regulator [Flavobacteriaceae bacterium]MDH3796818.1 Crp/Fnr family transcriptional regulator [Flavobacteriaceae bacterium]